MRAVLKLADGHEVTTCCARCVLHDGENRDAPVRDIVVTDYATGRALSFDSAFLVEGSDVTPCLEHHLVTEDTRVPIPLCYDRCSPSLIAFDRAGTSRSFVAAHGGTLHPPGTFPSLSASDR